MILIQIVIIAPVAANKRLVKVQKELEIRARVETIETTALFRYVAERNLYFCLVRNSIWPLESSIIFTRSGWSILFIPNHISWQH